MARNCESCQDENAVSVAEFLEGAKAAGMDVSVAAGAGGLGRVICEGAVNRPQLALTGFFQYFAHRRIQVLGHAEHSYLASLDESLLADRIEEMFMNHIPCIVITRKRKLLPELVAIAERLNVPALRSPLITGDFINAATLVMEDLRSPAQKVQGTMVEIMGVGAMITGEPGIGKSELALSLIKRGYSLVADDVTVMKPDSSGALICSAVESTQFHMELRGLGIVHVPSLFGISAIRAKKRLDMVIVLKHRKKMEDERPETEMREIFGVTIPHVTLPVAAGRDMAGLVEVAALDLKLKRLGHDAAKELDEKLIRVLTKGGGGSD